MQKKSDIKTFLSLVLWTLIPSVYLLIRMNIVSVNQVDINILGQMEWFFINTVIWRIFFVYNHNFLVYWQYFIFYESRICKEISSDAVRVYVDCIYRNIRYIAIPYI